MSESLRMAKSRGRNITADRPTFAIHGFVWRLFHISGIGCNGKDVEL